MSIKTQDKIINQCKSWADFVNFQDIQINTTQKGDLFERLVQLYLSTSPQYKSKLSNIWWPKYEELPKGVASYLNLSFPDEGIDLIAQTTNGEYWPIQAKYESNTEGAKQKSNLTTFANASFNYGENMHLGLVAHTKSKPIRKRKLLESEKKGNKIIELGLSHWLELDDDDWAAIKSKVSGEIYKPEKLTPRDHQKIAIKKAKNHFIKNKNNNGKLIMPCASGKSLTAYWIARELEAKTIIVAVPSLSLIKQTIKDWTREYIADNYQPEWICICSDKSTGELDQDNDDFVKDIYDVGLPVTTDKNDISKFLSNNTKSPKIIFTTYMSSKVLAEAVKKNNHIIDFCIFDEAHKTAGRKNKRSAALLSNSNIKIKKRLFMTATERYLSGTDKSERVNSMDNESVYGKCFHKLTFKEAIKEKIICDYKIITMTISKSEIDELVDEHKFVTNEDGESFIDAATLATGIALDKTITNYNVKHAITFHKSIKSAKSFKNQQIYLSKKGVTSSEPEYSHISSKLSTGERSKVISNFITANTSVITNAKCLTEGVDIPAIDCVVFASPKQSVVDIVQAAGRAMRPNHKSGKKFGYILLPIVVPENMEFEIFATSTEFNVIAKQLAALSTQDERIAEYFRLIEAGIKPTGDILEIIGSVPIGMDINFNEFASAIETKIWNKVGKINWRPFKEAREYVRTLGLKNSIDWVSYSKSGLRPPDIPGNPNKIYKDSGWNGTPDWLGNKNINYAEHSWATYDIAKQYASDNKVVTRADWAELMLTPDVPVNMPKNAEQYYTGKGWMGWYHFTGREKTKFVSYTDAQILVANLKIKSEADWRKLPKNMKIFEKVPRAPHSYYKEKGWVSWPHFLSKPDLFFFSYKDARLKSRAMKCKSAADWKRKTRDIKEFPAYPEKTYKDNGFTWSDFLDTEIQATNVRKYKSFEDCRKLMVSMHIRTTSEFDAIKDQLPFDIPRAPHWTYMNNGFKNYPHFFNQRDTDFLEFNDAKRLVRKLKLNSAAEYRAAAGSKDLPDRLPSNPSSYYKEKGWKSWPNFLKPNK
jgi:superfamily II DNA or RNA helicase